ncbi:MAG TPA: hypothetical protein ENF51_00305, partial [Candidatus Aenigmarchaeota archaeon]|nr:hypothetical protein [Candidatus Aenigmarchaeota archaeon]
KFNIIYPVGEGVFIHIYKAHEGGDTKYVVVEPYLKEEEKKLYKELYERVLLDAYYSEPPSSRKELVNAIIRLIDENVYIGRKNLLLDFLGKIRLDEHKYSKLKYMFIRDLVRLNGIEGLMRDPYIEDISCVGTNYIFVVHKVFGNLETNIRFKSEEELDKFLFRTSEIIERTVSEAHPIVDGILPDGSRVNIIYGTDVSRRGSSFTIRKFEAVPMSMTQLVKLNTFSPEEAAYLWLCIENGMNVFFCGETASGKTTSLRAATVFIRPQSKVFSVEDTPELVVPHENWQQTVTKEGVVDMYELLLAALRSRPDYLIVGEIRGAEGYVAFQAMQTGSSVMCTFHSSSLTRLVQRFTGKPINVPLPFLDNLNVVVFQQTLRRKGKMERRVLEIDEIEGYSRETGHLITRRVFEWDPVSDTHRFRGLNNSYILEEKVAKIMNMKERGEVYEELETRANLIKEFVANEVFNYYDLWEKIKKYHLLGLMEVWR